jgi:hypothetical protein
MVIKTNLTGCVTFWTLCESFNHDRLKAGWEALGLAEFVPAEREPLAYLREALNETAANSHILVRPLKSKTGFTVVRESRGDEDNSFQTLFNARFLENGTWPIFSVTNDETLAVEEAYRKRLGRLTNQQVAGALVKLMYHFGGTRLRPTGGVYWLSGDKVGAWKGATEALSLAAEGGSALTYFVEHELDADSIVAVRDAIIHEVANETRRIQEEIHSGELGEKGLMARKNEAAELKKKVLNYESILGVTLDALKKGLDSVDQSQAVAALLASAVATSFDQSETYTEPAHACVV